MATLYIEQYAHIVADAAGSPTPLPGQMVAHEPVTFTATPGQSAAMDPKTKFVCLTTDNAAHWVVGVNPTATTSDRYLPANTPRFFRVSGQLKISIRTAV